MFDYRYHLLDSLGSGGMGSVYRAYDQLTGEMVALKRLSAAALQHTSPELRLALAQEFQALAMLRHPHVIGVREYGFENAQQPYFTMDLLSGARPITTGAPYLADEAKVRLIWQLLCGLAYIHRHNLIHRDLKPANVLVVDNVVKVLDFGLATVAGEQRPPSGTLAYMAPELLQGAPATAATDLYAAGVIAFELFAGWHPFPTAPGEWLPLSERREVDFTYVSAAPALEQFLRTLLAPEPAERYTDAVTAVIALQEASGLDLPVETAETRESFLQAAPFVGRRGERQRLTHALQEARGGKGSAWVVRGESGIGKTRLLQALRTEALVEGVSVTRAQTAQGGAAPYQLWREALRPLMLAADLDNLEAAVLRGIVPDATRLLGRPIEEAPPLPSAEAARRRLASVVTALLRKMTAQRPLLLQLEDIHWADDDSMALLQQICHVATQLPLMITLTYRPGERPQLEPILQELRQLSLQRLAPADVAALSEVMLGRTGRQEELVAFLQNETEGNTFFIVEVMRTLAEEAGQLDRIAGMKLPLHVFAGGMQQMVQRRLGRVPSQYRTLLQLAAVAGRVLDLNVLANLAGEINLERWLTACANAIVLERPDGSTHWQFSHDKLREGIILSLSARRKQHSFATVARAVERVYARDLAPHYGRLAFFFGEAGQRSPQRHFLQLAATQAEATYANEAAVRYYQQLAEMAAAETSRAGALLHLGRVLHFTGKWTEALQQVEQALSLAETAADKTLQARAHFLIGRVARDRRLFAKALEALATARAHYAGAGVQTGECETLIEIGTCYYFQGEYGQAEAFLRQALQLARDLGDQRHTASALHNLANVYFDTGAYAKSQAYYEESLALSQIIGDKAKMASTINNLGILASYQGDLETTRHRYEQALAIRREIGDRLGIGVSLNNLGIVYKDMGDLEQATHCYESSLLIHQENEDRHSMSFPLNNLAAVAFERGDYEKARDLFQQALALRTETGDRWSIASVTSSLADVALAMEDYAEARRLYRQSLQAFGEIGDRLKIAYGLIGVVTILLRERPTLPAHPRAAATLLAFVQHMLATDRLALEQPHRRLLEQALAQLPACLDEDALAQSQQQGQQMTRDEAIALAATA